MRTLCFFFSKVVVLMIIQRAVKPWYTELGDGTKAITNSQLATKA